jgi:hypothetical protein
VEEAHKRGTEAPVGEAEETLVEDMVKKKMKTVTRRSNIQMAQAGGHGEEFLCPNCDAVLTNNAQRAYFFIGPRSLWNCKACGKKAY